MGIENLAKDFLVISVPLSERSTPYFITLSEISQSNDPIGLRADSRSPKKLARAHFQEKKLALSHGELELFRGSSFDFRQSHNSKSSLM